jgi:glutathione S-transferase
MAERMFLVSTNITAADIVVFAALASYFAKELKDFEKIALAHAFRWIDHI